MQSLSVNDEQGGRFQNVAIFRFSMHSTVCVFTLGGFSPVQEETSWWQRTETEKQLQQLVIYTVLCVVIIKSEVK